MRSILIHPDELDGTWIFEAKKHGISRIGLHPEGGKYANESLLKLMDQLQSQSLLSSLDEADGLEIEYEMHALRYLLPSELLTAHPDWFRLTADGVRTADFNCCATNPEGLAFLGRRAGELAKTLYRSTHRFFFWMDDVGSDSICHCPACRGYSPSDQQLLVMNALLSGIRKVIPDAKLAYLAYANCFEIPTKVDPAEGIFLQYAPMDRDFDKAMDDPTSEKNALQCKYLPKLMDFFGKDDAVLLEYWLDNSMFSRWKKPPKKYVPNTRVIQADLSYYSSAGFTDISTFACFLGADYRALYGLADITPFAENQNPSQTK